VPGLATLTTAVALVVLALVVLDELAGRKRLTEGLVAGTLIVASLYVWPQHGSEIPVALALLAVAARLSSAWPGIAGALAALAAWGRPELAIGAVTIACVDGLRRRSLPRRYLACLVAILAAAAAFDRVTMGTFLPVTLAAKRAQAVWLPGSFVSGAEFWLHSLGYVKDIGMGALTSLFLGMGLAGLPLIWIRGGPAARILALQCAALAVAYPLLGVADYPWYSIPPVLLLSISLPLAAGELVRTTARQFADRPRRSHVVAVLTAGGLMVPFLIVWPSRARDAYQRLAQNYHYDLYRRTGEWLRDNTPPGASVAYVEVGTIGFFSERSVQDLLGLVTPRSIPYVPSGDMRGAFLAAPTDYFLFDRLLVGFLAPVMNEPWFDRNYRSIAQLDALPGGNGEQIVIYRRRRRARFPPPRPPIASAQPPSRRSTGALG